jgi:hypothetical protein
MRLDTTKATLGGAWILTIGALALSDVAVSGTNRALLVVFGLVPVVVMWAFWNPPTLSLSESIRKAQE